MPPIMDKPTWRELCAHYNGLMVEEYQRMRRISLPRMNAATLPKKVLTHRNKRDTG